MALQSLFAFLLLQLFAAPAFAGDPLMDMSSADTDGPHVFYRGSNIVVKRVERQDTSVKVRVNYYTRREGITLTCTVPQTGDAFSFQLKEKHRVEKEFYRLPKKMLVLSDVEGNFSVFKTMLQSTRVINETFDWTFGEGHLVLVGDFFDRGLNVTEVLWLIYKLESEADAAGGKVHFILGNHEIMNLCGEHTYVRKKYLENAELIGEDYGLWYDNHSELGRWLRTKNAVERIGEYVFCHGGISPMLAASSLTLRDINDITRQNLGKNYRDISDSTSLLVFDTQQGIFWYRGAAKNKLTREEVDGILAYAGARRMVIGHTMVTEVLGLYDGKVVCVDVFHEENLRTGLLKTLYIEEGRMYTVDSKGGKEGVFTVTFTNSKKER